MGAIEQFVDIALRQPLVQFDGVFEAKLPDTAPRPLHLAVTGHRQGGDLPATRAGVRMEGQLGPGFEQPKCALVVADTAEEHHLHGLTPRGLGDPAARSNRIGDRRDPRGWRNHLQPGGPCVAERHDGARSAESGADYRLDRPRRIVVVLRETGIVDVQNNGHTGELADPEEDPLPHETRVCAGVQVNQAGAEPDQLEDEQHRAASECPDLCPCGAVPMGRDVADVPVDPKLRLLNGPDVRCDAATSIRAG